MAPDDDARPRRGAAWLRVFQPLAAYPDAVQARLIAASHRTRSEVEAEAGRRARRRLLRTPADPFPAPGEDELVRLVQDGHGSAFYCPDEAGLRAEMAAALLEEATTPSAFAAAVPVEARAANRGRALVALEDEWGLSPDPDAEGDDAGARHRVQTRTAAWGVPHGWLVAFDPAEAPEPLPVDAARAYRRATVVAALERVRRATGVLARHAPEAEVLGELTVMAQWLESFHPDSVLELDYGGLTAHVWPDESPADLWTLLEALDDGDEATAGVAQERLNRRWGPVGMLARAC